MDFTPPHSHSDYESYSRRLERGVYARDGLDDYSRQNEQRDRPTDYSLPDNSSIGLNNHTDVQNSAAAAS